MTLANQITIMRILLVPVFVGCAVYFGESVRAGAPSDLWKWGAMAAFGFSAAGDALDGFIARRFNQITRLGGILDPIADKALMITTIVTLTFCGWPGGFPLWFPILVVSIHVIQVVGALLLGHVAGLSELKPHWTGKVATALQMIAISWVLLEISEPDVLVPTTVAGVFTVIAWLIYANESRIILQEAEKENEHHS